MVKVDLLILALVTSASCKSNEHSSGSANERSSGGTGSSQVATKSLRSASPAGMVDAVTLTSEFDNEVKAAQDYSGKTYDIRGMLEYAKNSGDLGLGPHLVLKGAKYVDVACQVDVNELDALAALAPHAEVTVRGVITGENDGRFLYVKPCIVAPVAPSTPN